MNTTQLQSLEPRKLFATFAVTSVLDGGNGSLRAAIDQANATAGADTIAFNIGAGGGAFTLAIGSPLTITQPITIDGTTQPGYAGSPLIRVADGNTVGTGIIINAANSVVRGLSITGFGNAAIAGDGTGISVNASGVIIEKSHIGLRGDGVADGNEGDGVNITTLGTNTAIRDNVIGSNLGDGVEVNADYVAFNNNIIGLDPAGSSARGNAQHGIRVQKGFDAQLGVGGLGNVVSANGQAGLYMTAGAGSARVFSSLFGLSKSGNAMLANGTYGIDINGVQQNLIGNAGAGNRFGGSGIRITGNSGGNNIRHNAFGFGVNTIFDVGGTLGINVEGGHANINDNTLGRLETAIRYVGNVGIIQFNNVGITESGIAIPNQLGITINGESNDVRYNYVSNNALYGVWVIGGDKNILRNQAWNNGQSIWVSSGANSDLPVADIQTITQNADGTMTASASGMITTAGTYRFVYYSSDTPGHAASGDTQRFIQSVDSQKSVGQQSFTTTIPAGKLLDGHYLSVQVCKIGAGNTLGAGGEPGASKKAVGLPAVYSNTFEYETGHSWSLKFSADVGASLQASDLDIRNPFNVTYAATSVTWNAATKTARFVRSPALPDAFYTVSLKAGSVSSVNGANIGTAPITFRVIRGDANNDDHVDFADLVILAQNYNKTGRTWSTGDFNYDGNCNFTDLVFLAQRYSSTPASVSSPSTSSASNWSAVESTSDTLTKRKRPIALVG